MPLVFRSQDHPESRAKKLNQLVELVGGMEPFVAPGDTDQYWRGDKTWQDLIALVVLFSPAGNIVATNVQAAIEELDAEKLAASTYTAADILTKLLTVDGAGSGLDADLLDGQSGAFYLARANHTGTQTAATISDFTEASQDAVGAALTNTATIGWTYIDAGNQIKADVNARSITFDTYMQTIATAKVLGRTTAGSGNIEELAITGTGNVVLSASPTLTGTLAAAAATFSGAVTVGAGLSVTGSIAATDYIATTKSGSVSDVEYRIGNDANTGFYLSAADTITFAAAGQQTYDASSTQHVWRTSGTIRLALTATTLDMVGLMRCDSFRIDQAPVAATPTPTHTFTISLNGTTYRVPCVV